MAITLVKALAYADQLRSATWRARFQDQPWEVNHVRLFKDGDELHMECDIASPAGTRRLILAEHFIGGRDYLQVDSVKYDADHTIEVVPKGFPPALKIKIISRYDVDEATGYEEELLLYTKIAP